MAIIFHRLSFLFPLDSVQEGGADVLDTSELHKRYSTGVISATTSAHKGPLVYTGMMPRIEFADTGADWKTLFQFTGFGLSDAIGSHEVPKLDDFGVPVLDPLGNPVMVAQPIYAPTGEGTSFTFDLTHRFYRVVGPRLTPAERLQINYIWSVSTRFSHNGMYIGT